jgi:hypothetical protein
MKPALIAAAVAFVSVIANAADAQTCQVIGQMVFCQPAPATPSGIGGGYTGQRIGNSTFYNYSNPQAARAQGLPNSAQQIGNTRFLTMGSLANLSARRTSTATG